MVTYNGYSHFRLRTRLTRSATLSLDPLHCRRAATKYNSSRTMFRRLRLIDEFLIVE